MQGLLADVYLFRGEAEEALALAEAELARIGKDGERQFVSPLLAIKGDALLALPSPNEAKAEASYREAIEVARGQSARAWELRAATRLAHLWHSQGKTTEAHDLLERDEVCLNR